MIATIISFFDTILVSPYTWKSIIITSIIIDLLSYQ